MKLDERIAVLKLLSAIQMLLSNGCYGYVQVISTVEDIEAVEHEFDAVRLIMDAERLGNDN